MRPEVAVESRRHLSRKGWLPWVPGRRPRAPVVAVRWLGNDVVDLRDPRCAGKSTHARFMARIFAPEEACSIRDAPDPDLHLWTTWAAKEAAFKVITKLLGDPPPFEHAAFVFRPIHEAAPRPVSGITPASDAESEPVVTGTVTYRGTEVPVRVEPRTDRVHAVAWHPRDPSDPVHQAVKILPDLGSPSGSEWKRRLRSRFTEREWGSIHRPVSALTRLGARRHLSRVLQVEERALQIVCDAGPPGRMPPRVLVHGKDWEGDLTLSHHGRFLAWAFAAGGIIPS